MVLFLASKALQSAATLVQSKVFTIAQKHGTPYYNYLAPKHQKNIPVQVEPLNTY